jgi:uncharacterized protein
VRSLQQQAWEWSAPPDEIDPGEIEFRDGGSSVSDQSEYEAHLQQFVGRSSGPPSLSHDPVNQPMIRHWIEAVGDENPVYVDDEAAKEAGFPGVIAPPTMLQAWIMRGYKASFFPPEEYDGTSTDEVMSLLDSGGFTSVVATDCEQEYKRPLVLGDRLSVSSRIESISPAKKTALGEGHFLTTLLEYTDQSDEIVATMRFRILKFRPAGAPAQAAPATEAGSAPEAAQKPPRPMPAITQDSAFFFEGARNGELLIQKCDNCGTLRHPPRPGCPKCQSLDWSAIAASGKGKIFSYVVVHYPQVPSFDYPLPVVLVELEEGTRIVSNIEGVQPDEVTIGMPVEVGFRTYSDDLTLPVFRPAALRPDSVEAS